MSHDARCIEQALASIEQNNEDTLVENGMNQRIEAAIAANPGKPAWLITNELYITEREDGIAARTLTPETPAMAREWVEDGTVECRCESDA